MQVFYQKYDLFLVFLHLFKDIYFNIWHNYSL